MLISVTMSIMLKCENIVLCEACKYFGTFISNKLSEYEELKRYAVLG